MTFFGFLYDLGLHLYLCTCLPKIISNFSKYKASFLQRLGLSFPQVEKKGKKLIWIHAVSVGETRVIEPLIKRLKSISNPPLILLSTTTQTGHAEGLKNAPLADFHVYLPFDFSYIIRPIVKRVAPDIVILTETDFWHHFQDAGKKAGAKLILINGKISERSCKRLSKLPFLSKRLFDSIDHFYLQGDIYYKRFIQLKIPSSKLTIAGNLKLDNDLEVDNISLLKQEIGLTNQTVLTLGSTHSPEEKIWITALKTLWQRFPNLNVLIVPRHPERFDDVAKLLESEKISFSRWSQGGTFKNHSILLVDAMGVLRKCYQISNIAFVGGSFTSKVGGHNILEPAFYGKPVLFGPYMHSQPGFLDLVKTYQAGLQISEESLIPTMHQLLSDVALSNTLGSNGQKLIASSRGSLEFIFNELLSLLQKDTI